MCGRRFPVTGLPCTVEPRPDAATLSERSGNRCGHSEHTETMSNKIEQRNSVNRNGTAATNGHTKQPELAV